jgi:outer membrane protein assembly factor BamB
MAPRKVALTLFLALGTAAGITGMAFADNWPRFRGPNGTGIANDKDVPVEWNERDGILWKTPIPGAGHSSPVVWHHRIFVQSATPEADGRLLLCVNAADGKVLWSRSMPATRAHINEHNSWASSTPAVDGKRVYAVFWDGHDMLVTAHDLNGKFLWKHDLGSFTSQHGAAVSPMVCNAKVIVANDQDGSAELVALDARTGDVAWQAPRKAFRACYSTPFVLERQGKAKRLIVASTAGITSYDPQTGREDWNWKWPFTGMALRTVASPVATEGLIIASSGDGNGSRDAVAVRANGDGGATRVWEKKRDMPYVPTMLAWGEYVYWVHDKGLAIGCMVAKTGKTVWSERLGEPVSASPVLIDGKIYVVGEQGTVFVFKAGPTYQRLAKNSVGEGVMATPAVADNRLFIRGGEHLICIGKGRTRRAAGLGAPRAGRTPAGLKP